MGVQRSAAVLRWFFSRTGRRGGEHDQWLAGVVFLGGLLVFGLLAEDFVEGHGSGQRMVVAFHASSSLAMRVSSSASSRYSYSCLGFMLREVLIGCRLAMKVSNRAVSVYSNATSWAQALEFASTRTGSRATLEWLFPVERVTLVRLLLAMGGDGRDIAVPGYGEVARV